MDYRSLAESYQQIYSQPQVEEEYLSEEVEVASQFFASIGLNEEGVEIFAEEMGSEDFFNFISEINEEFELTEAAALTGKRPSPSEKGSVGAKISRKAKPGKTTKERVASGGGQMKSAAPGGTISKTKRAPRPEPKR